MCVTYLERGLVCCVAVLARLDPAQQESQEDGASHTLQKTRKSFPVSLLTLSWRLVHASRERNWMACGNSAPTSKPGA